MYLSSYGQTNPSLIMKTILFLFLIAQSALAQSFLPVQAKPKESLSALQREVVSVFKKHADVAAFIFEEQDIEVGFMVNARNELIIQDVTADSDELCAYVKEVLAFKKIKFTEAKPLQRYTITFRINRQDKWM
jgi:hypothetical protein